MPTHNNIARCMVALMSVLATTAWLAGCAGSVSGTLPPPPPGISVTITPNTGSVLLGTTLAFTSQVANSGNQGVTWSVNGTNGGSAQAGTISAAGVYTAPD